MPKKSPGPRSFKSSFAIKNPSFEFSNEENMFIETQSSKLKQKSHINKNSNINIKTKSQIDSTENARAINLVNMNNIKTGMAA